jgi:nickel transport protein
MMKWVQRYLALFGLCALIQAFYVPCADAHGTAYRVLENAKAVTAEFFYDDRDPMQYAEVLVFSPLDEKVEHQNGRTDRYGRFAFYPADAGTWRIEVKDGMGHMVQGVIEVAPDAKEQTESVKSAADDRATVSGRASKSGNIVFGLSIMFNLAALAYLWKNRTAMKKRPEQ